MEFLYLVLSPWAAMQYFNLLMHVSKVKYTISINDKIEHPRKNPKRPPTSATTRKRLLII